MRFIVLLLLLPTLSACSFLTNHKNDLSSFSVYDYIDNENIDFLQRPFLCTGEFVITGTQSAYPEFLKTFRHVVGYQHEGLGGKLNIDQTVYELFFDESWITVSWWNNKKLDFNFLREFSFTKITDQLYDLYYKKNKIWSLSRVAWPEFELDIHNFVVQEYEIEGKISNTRLFLNLQDKQSLQEIFIYWNIENGGILGQIDYQDETKQKQFMALTGEYKIEDSLDVKLNWSISTFMVDLILDLDYICSYE